MRRRDPECIAIAVATSEDVRTVVDGTSVDEVFRTLTETGMSYLPTVDGDGRPRATYEFRTLEKEK